MCVCVHNFSQFFVITELYQRNPEYLDEADNISHVVLSSRTIVTYVCYERKVGIDPL